MEAYQETLCRIAIHGDTLPDSRATGTAIGPSWLDERATALVRIAALASVGAAPQSYAATVEQARQAGASDEEIVGVLVAVIPVLGAPRVISAAASLGLALGFDLEAALEECETVAPSS